MRAANNLRIFFRHFSSGSGVYTRPSIALHEYHHWFCTLILLTLWGSPPARQGSPRARNACSALAMLSRSLFVEMLWRLTRWFMVSHLPYMWSVICLIRKNESMHILQILFKSFGNRFGWVIAFLDDVSGLLRLDHVQVGDHDTQLVCE